MQETAEKVISRASEEPQAPVTPEPVSSELADMVKAIEDATAQPSATPETIEHDARTDLAHRDVVFTRSKLPPSTIVGRG